MALFRVYTGRMFLEAEPTTLMIEAEYRRYSAPEASIVARASNERAAKRIAHAMTTNGCEHLARIEYEGPRKAVPVCYSN